MNENSYCIILAGGIGSRLWPVSRTSKPKQFLDLFGTGRTLLQTTYDRMSHFFPQERIYVSTCTSLLPLVLEQLPKINTSNLLSEPLRRGTLPAAAWANAVIYERDPEASIICTPSDQLILRESDFENDIIKALEFVHKRRCVLTLGITPTRPDTFYGYIQSDGTREGDGFSRVKAFTEKPDEQFAKMFVDSGEFYWNTGINLWHCGTMQTYIEQILPDHTAAMRDEAIQNGEQLSYVIYKNFGSLPNMSLDIAIQEKVTPVYVRICSFGWADMGNWHSIHDDLPSDKDGNVTLHSEAILYDCSGNIIKMPRGTTVVMQDIHDMVVVEENGILLIAPKDNHATLRRIMTDAQMKLRR